MNVLDNIALSIEEQIALTSTFPSKALAHATARFRTSKYPVRSPFAFINKVANDYCRDNNLQLQQQDSDRQLAANFQQREMQETFQSDLGYNSAPSPHSVRGPRGHRSNEHRPIGNAVQPRYTSYDQYVVNSWKIKNFSIQQLADDMRGCQKIINGCQENNIDDALHKLIPSIFRESGLEFAKARLKELFEEFNRRSPEEQSQAK